MIDVPIYECCANFVRKESSMSSASGLFREPTGQSHFVSKVVPTATDAQASETPAKIRATGKIKGKSAQLSVPPLDDFDKQLLTHFGSDAVLNAFAERLYVFFKLTASDRASEECRGAVLQAAQMCLHYGMMPGAHIYIARRGKEWIVDTRLRAWIDSANQEAREAHFTYVVDYAELNEEAVRQFTPPEIPYTPGDLGWAARVLRSDHIALYRSVGSPYEPEWCYGFWRHNGYKEYDIETDSWSDWLPDPIWHNRAPADTAKNRATKAALMKQFSLLPLRSAYNPRSLIRYVDEELMERGAPPARDPHAGAMFAEKPINREEDGDIVFA